MKVCNPSRTWHIINPNIIVIRITNKGIIRWQLYNNKHRYKPYAYEIMYTMDQATT